MNKKITPIILFVISIMLVITFIIDIRLDWLNHYEHLDIPYYKCVLISGLKFILPSLISFIAGIILIKRKH